MCQTQNAKVAFKYKFHQSGNAKTNAEAQNTSILFMELIKQHLVDLDLETVPFSRTDLTNDSNDH